MSLETIDTATFEVKNHYRGTPSVVLLTDATELAELPATVRESADQFWLGAEAGREPAMPAPCRRGVGGARTARRRRRDKARPTTIPPRPRTG